MSQKPNSSENRVKIKSVCFLVNNQDNSVNHKKPFPNNPPDPMAIFDCIIWYPAPKGSLSGFKKVAF